MAQDTAPVTEVWRRVPSFDSRYEVSNLGRVRFCNGRVRKLKTAVNGYLLLSVANGRGSADNVSVARLVCEAFHGACPEGFEVDHANRDRADNRPENLRWVSKAFNLAQRQLPCGTAHHAARLNEEAIRLIRSGETYRGRNSQLARQFGVSRETVRDVRNGKYWRHVG